MNLDSMKCPHCDAPVRFKKNKKDTICEYCGQTVIRDRTELDDLQDISERMRKQNIEMVKAIFGGFRK